MKKYTFQMTKKEFRELCFRMLWEFLLLNPFKGLLMLVIFVLEGIILWEIVPFANVLAPLSIAAVLEGLIPVWKSRFVVRPGVCGQRMEC